MSYVLEDVITLRQHSCFDKTKLTKCWSSKLNNNKKSFINCGMKFFTKLRQLTLLQSAMDCLIDSKLRQLFFLFYNYKCDRVYYIATRITKRDDFTACNSTRVRLHIPPPSLPPLSLKARRDCKQRRKCFSFKFLCAYLV